jgi:hypothetical protein
MPAIADTSADAQADLTEFERKFLGENFVSFWARQEERALD